MKPIAILLACILATLLFAAIRACGAEITLAWDANTDSVTRGYNLYSSSGGPPLKRDVGTNTVASTVVVGGATNIYYVTAYDAAGMEGPPSNTVTNIAALELTAPVFTSQGIIPGAGFWTWPLQWGAVPGAMGYELQTVTQGGAQSYTTTNLNARLRLAGFETFLVRVRATNAASLGPWSEQQSATLQSPNAVTLNVRKP